MCSERTNTGQSRPLARLEGCVLVGWRTLPHSPVGDQLAIEVSQFADQARGWIVVGVLGGALQRSKAPRWLAAAATVAATEQASRQLKRVVRRSRPQLEGLPPLAGVTARYSFPSSHTATAVAAVYAFDGLLPRPVLIGWAVLTAASRPYLGVHYPSDVLGGAILGYTIGRATQAIASL
jgi:membrane-associated phospholipid phosphatase